MRRELFNQVKRAFPKAFKGSLLDWPFVEKHSLYQSLASQQKQLQQQQQEFQQQQQKLLLQHQQQQQLFLTNDQDLSVDDPNPSGLLTVTLPELSESVSQLSSSITFDNPVTALATPLVPGPRVETAGGGGGGGGGVSPLPSPLRDVSVSASVLSAPSPGASSPLHTHTSAQAHPEGSSMSMLTAPPAMDFGPLLGSRMLQTIDRLEDEQVQSFINS